MVALGEERRERALRGQVALPGGHPLRLAQRGLQGPRRHEEADPERGQQRLGERADVDHPAVAVEALQRLDGLVGRSGTRCRSRPRRRRRRARAAQRSSAARRAQRHRDAGRELVGRRHVDQTGVRAAGRRRRGPRRRPVRRARGAVRLEEAVHRASSPGSSTATTSPGATSTRPTRSTACWAPGGDDDVVAGRDDRAGQPEEAGDLALQPAGARGRRRSPPPAASGAAGRRPAGARPRAGRERGPGGRSRGRGAAGRAAGAARLGSSHSGSGRTAPAAGAAGARPER